MGNCAYCVLLSAPQKMLSSPPYWWHDIHIDKASRENTDQPMGFFFLFHFSIFFSTMPKRIAAFIQPIYFLLSMARMKKNHVVRQKEIRLCGSNEPSLPSFNY